MKFEDMINNIINCDCYEMIKNIPDKSIDCIYVDVPYLYETGSYGKSELSKRIYKYQKSDLKKAGIYDGYELKSKWYISSINKNDKDLYNHPTIKPLELVKRHILHTTQPNDIVLDCFCGSGTTCVACKETDRRYIGMEINKEYYEIAQKRINGITANGQMSMMFNNKGEPLND